MGAQVSTSGSRFRAWVPILGGLVIVVALVWIWVTDTAADLDPDSAEGVVQRYTASVIAGDDRSALQLLTDDEQDCDAPHREQIADMSVSLISVDVTGDRAEVRVSMTQTGQEGLFGPDEWRSEAVFELERTTDGWRIERAPWELQVCDTPAPEAGS